MVNVVILGTGAREHAIQSKLCHATHMCSTQEEVFEMCAKGRVDMVVVGSETHLVSGITDKLTVNCFGPSRSAAMIEGSKIFAKQFMQQYGIATAEYVVAFSKYDAVHSIKTLFTSKPYVIKLDRLYGGKGVYLPATINEAYTVLDGIYDENPYEKIIIEERLNGIECSVMGFCNGHDVYLMPQVMDYKRSDDGNVGLNTGGMGAIGPVTLLTETELGSVKKYMEQVVRKLNFRGVLYTGVMKTDDGCFVLEFNCRFGDPETQVVLNLLESDLYDIMHACVHGLDCAVTWNAKHSAAVVLAHTDYPTNKLSEPTKITTGAIPADVTLHWGNCIARGDGMYTTGGRVCSVVHTSDDLKTSLEVIYNTLPQIEYAGKYYRRDIGVKYLTQHSNLRPLRIGVVASGNGTSCTALLEKQAQMNVKISVIVSNKPSGILDKGCSHGVPTLYLPRNQDDYFKTLTNVLQTFDVDIIFLIGFNKIVPASFCEHFKGKLFNIHPSLLPDYSGLYDLGIHRAVLANRDSVSGCTLHHVTPEVDKGPIALQRQLRVGGDWGALTLKKEIQKLESEVIVDYVKVVQNSRINYSNAGVNIAKADAFVEQIKNKHIGSFCSVMDVNGVTLGVSTDGVGTKLDLAISENKFDTIGIDLVAMCVNDLLVRGIRPTLFLDYIAVDKLDDTKLVALINGIKAGCATAGCELVGGETAEMPGLYVAGGMDLAGFAVGVLHQQLYPKLEGVEKGCKLYGVKSTGVHSNGYSLVRKLLKYNDYDRSVLLKPTKIYTECLEIIDRYGDQLLGMAHITGGGLIDNTKRIIPAALTPRFTVPIKDEFKWIMDTSGLTYDDMLSTFNCGYGLVVLFKKGVVCSEFDEIGILV